MRIVGLDDRFDLREVECAVGAVREHVGLDGAEHRETARLVTVAVLLGADDDFVAALAMAHQRGEVRLRPGRKEERRVEAEHLCGAFLQPVDGRIVAEHVVAELCFHHRAAHGR